MRKFLIAAFAVLAVLASCSKPAPDALTMTSSELNFTNKGGSQTISFTSNVAWTASSDKDWVTLSATSGEAGNASITLTVDANPAYSNRTANVTITAGSVKSSYKVSQSEETVFSPGVVNVIDASAQQVSISISTNKEYSVVIDETAVGWVKLVSTKSEPVTKQVVLQISANTGLQKRTGFVTVSTDSDTFLYNIEQSSNYTETSFEAAAYISNRQKVYDNENYCPTTFGQYAIALAAENGEVVLLVLNQSKDSVNKTALPVGEFTCNYEGDHAHGTFSTVTLDNSEPIFTCFGPAAGEPKVVADGTINIEKDGDNYTIAAALYDENEQLHSFSYVGAVTVQDNSIGLQIGSVAYKADYETYFVNDNSQWDFNFYVSEPIAAEMPYIYNLGLSIFDGQGVVDPQAIPTGTFTLTAEDRIESPYKTGTLRIENGKALGNGGYADYNYDGEGGYKSVTLNSGTVEISKTGEYYNFKFNLNVTVDSKEVYDWTYEFKDVIMPEASDNQLRPQPDVDMEFKGNVFPNNGYSGSWYEDAYSLGGNVFWVGWSSSVEGWYTVTVPLHSKTPWKFEKNFNNKFCNTPVPDGEYGYVVNKPVENGDFIPNLKMRTRSFLIKNDYTGSTVYIDKGSVKIEGEKFIFDAEGYIKLSNGTVTTDRVKFTGWLPNQIFYVRDFSGSKYQVDWAETE